MLINAYCENRGWLFEDLKAAMVEEGAMPSEEPIPHADAYICIRSREAAKVADKSKLVLQVHDMFTPVTQAAIVSFVHPAQQRHWYWNGFESASFVQPIGSRDIGQGKKPEQFTLGFFCRECGTKGSAVFAQAVELARKTEPVNVLMIGERLEHIAYLGKYERRAADQNDYKRISALMTCSESIMTPLGVFEAIACGRPVISTPREMPNGNWPMVSTARTIEGLAELIIKQARQAERRYEPYVPYTRTQWAKRQVTEAMALCKQPSLL